MKKRNTCDLEFRFSFLNVRDLVLKLRQFNDWSNLLMFGALTVSTKWDLFTESVDRAATYLGRNKTSKHGRQEHRGRNLGNEHRRQKPEKRFGKDFERHREVRTQVGRQREAGEADGTWKVSAFPNLGLPRTCESFGLYSCHDQLKLNCY